MTPAERNLNVAVFKTTEATAIITTAIVHAAHGEQAQRSAYLDRAIRNAVYLVDHLKTAKLQLMLEQTASTEKEGRS